MSATGRRVKPVLIAGLTAAALVLALAAWLVREFVHDVIVRPLFVAVQWILLYVRSVPQEFYWLLLVGGGVYSAVRSIRRERRPRRPAPRAYRAQTGVAGELLDWTIRARRNRYYRKRLAELLARDLCRSLRLRGDRARPLEILTREGVAVPEYLENNLGEERRTGWRARLPFFAKKQAAIELQRLEEAVSAVEEQVGVHGQRHSI